MGRKSSARSDLSVPQTTPAKQRQKTTVPSFFQLSAAEIASFSEEKFKEFIKALIQAELARLRVPVNAVIFSEEIKATDAGADASTQSQPTKTQGPINTKRPHNDPSHRLIPEGKTVWQFKAESRKPQPHQLKEELNKDAVIDCLKSGGSFVLAAQQPNTAPATDALQKELRKLAVKKRFKAKQVHFLAQSELQALAARYPSLARQMSSTHGEFGSLRAGVEWVQDPAHKKSEFQKVGERADQIAIIRQWLEIQKDRQHLRVIGSPGVGKTRLVLEALKSANVLSLVVYASGATEIPPGFSTTLRGNVKECILVIDECPDSALLNFLSENFDLLPRLRLITIGHVDDEQRQTFDHDCTLIQLDPLENEAIQSILQKSHPDLPPDRRSWVSDKTKGFVKLALLLADAVWHESNFDLAKSDEQTLIAKHLSKLLGSSLNRDYLEWLALASKVGVGDAVRHENECIREWIDLPSSEANKTLHKAAQNNILAEAGPYRYVTPELLAAWLSIRLVKVSAQQIEDFLAQPDCPDDLLKGAARRLRALAIEPASARLIKKLMSPNGALHRRGIFENPSLARAVSHLARALPKMGVQLLERLTRDVQPEELARWIGGRRELVWLLPDLLWATETFDNAFEVALRLARAENEPGIANNATGVLSSIFLIHLAPTQASFQYRIELAERLRETADEKTRCLLTKAVSHALREWEMSWILPSTQTLEGNWRPTISEFIPSRRLALKFLRSSIEDASVVVRNVAISEFLKVFRGLVILGPDEECLEAIQHIALQDECVSAAREALESSLCFDKNALKPEVVVRLHETLAALPSDLLHRVRTFVGSWGFLPEMRAQAGLAKIPEPHDVAKDILASDQPARLVRVLYEREAKNPGPLAHALGEVDDQLALLPEFMENARKVPSAWLVSLYLGGTLSGKKARKHCFTMLESGEVLEREIAAQALTVAPGFSEGVDQLCKALETNRIEPKWLRGIVFGGWTKTVKVDDLERLLQHLLKTGSDAGISLTAAAAHQAQHAQVQINTRLLLSIVLAGLGQVSDSDVWAWGELAKAVAEESPEQLGQAIIDLQIQNYRDNFLSRREILEEVFDHCLQSAGKVLANHALKVVLVDGKCRHEVLQLIKGRLLEQVGIDHLIDWATKHGTAAQFVLASLLPPNATEVTFKALTRFGAKSIVGETLADIFSSGAIVGDFARHYEENAKHAQRWADDEKLPSKFREWAQAVAQRERARAEQWRQHQKQEEILRKLDE